jgi:hypothetical protein
MAAVYLGFLSDKQPEIHCTVTMAAVCRTIIVISGLYWFGGKLCSAGYTKYRL